MSNFTFKPAPWVPFQDEEVLKKLRPMTAEDIVKHPNPNFRIHIGPNATTAEMCDMFSMIMRSDLMDENFTFKDESIIDALAQDIALGKQDWIPGVILRSNKAQMCRFYLEFMKHLWEIFL